MSKEPTALATVADDNTFGEMSATVTVATSLGSLRSITTNRNHYTCCFDVQGVQASKAVTIVSVIFADDNIVGENDTYSDLQLLPLAPWAA